MRVGVGKGKDGAMIPQAPLSCRQAGFSLVVFTVLIGLLLTLGFVLSSIVVTDVHSSVSSLEAAQALASAEAGIELATGWLRSLPTAPQELDPFPFATDLQVGTGVVSVLIIPDPGNSLTYLKRFTVRSQATVGEATRRVEVQVRMASFADFLWATNSEGTSTLWYYTGDVLDGPLFTNDAVAIYGSPVFLGPVYSAAPSFKKGAVFNPEFRAGYRLGVPRITLPSISDVMNNVIQYGSGSPYILYGGNKNPVKLRFRVQGGVGYVQYHALDATGMPVTGQVAVDQIPDGVLRIRGDVQVQGTLKGALTVLAEKSSPIEGGNIYIEDDIFYSCADASGRPLPGCEDKLGLVAESNVIVSDNSSNSQDCIIDAAILALGTSFKVENHASGKPRGKLIVWGSIAQSVRGPVGTFSGNKQKTGFLKEYHFDPRLPSAPPPFYPKAGVYIVEAWREITTD
ncbi:MAG: DUF4900 domain-containing protein [candidate division KSB1 bacterium]|nr:DUF4900 domain-containing protein [candidate division KSB1 bacterium]